MVLNIEEEIDARIAAMEAEPYASTPPGDVRREILLVNEIIHTTGMETAPRMRGLSQIELLGIATPNSQVTRGIIRFRPEGELRAPYYKDADHTIRVWLDIRHLDHVLWQLNHRKRWIWVGTWPDGFTYADLHSRP
ncbi:hypothetical protein SAMN06297129_2664 [Pseudooceanicola antarcticus]|uniref:Uncharacterized protein n=1 Tax=Pseudooceanicola antarcticus TaxID=1247613 RepID=A0A285J1H2_9RHOB|nr:hypothetical protein [Pseudooceanicola antarcticus]PJE29916.1 hypothetical protein CVM39_08470 [Pseudooceanicola antarcticus]SNY53913.1 hypothetical protein SAMN06297129_2664 [Pseudooceanicola antarcticus]